MKICIGGSCSTNVVNRAKITRLFLSQEVFPVEYGPQYANDLQTLFSEFIYRLNQLLPVPDMEQVR